MTGTPPATPVISGAIPKTPKVKCLQDILTTPITQNSKAPIPDTEDTRAALGAVRFLPPDLASESRSCISFVNIQEMHWW